MATPTSLPLFTNLFTSVNGALNTYIQSTATSIISSITPVTTTLLTIYIMLWGWSMMRGTISEPVTDGVGRLIRLSIIIGIAINLGRYNSFIVDFLWNLPDALAALVASGSSNPATNMSFLDTFFGQFNDTATAFNDAAYKTTNMMGLPDLTLWIIGWAVRFAGMALTAYAAFLLILAKIGLAILLGIGPIFILLTIFEPTKRFFDSWLGQALNYIFLALLTSAIIKIVLQIIQGFLAALDLTNVSFLAVLPTIGFCIIGVLVLMQIPSVASALGGGVAISSLGAVGALYGKGKNAMAATRPVNVRRQFNRGMADFKIATAPVRAVWNATRGNNKVKNAS